MREKSVARQSSPVRARVFSTPTMNRLLARELRQVSLVLAHVFGTNALLVRPDPRAPAVLTGLMAYQHVRLHRSGASLAGDVVACDSALPFASESFSLVLLHHSIESSPDPGGMLDEVTRVLAPEGTVVLIGFNPLAPMRLRWRRAGLRAIRAATMARVLAARGLEVRKLHGLGSIWRIPENAPIDEPAPASALASSWLLVARKRVPGVTPLPAGNAHVAWSAG